MERTGRLLIVVAVLVLGYLCAVPFIAQELLLPPQCPEPKVGVLNAVLTDDGDHDGFADTLETVQMRITVRNISGENLTGLTVHLYSNDPTVCVTQRDITIGDLLAGEERLSTESFVFHVTDVDRTDAFETLTASFEASANAAPFGDSCVRGTLDIDLDLDITGGGNPTTYIEDFESGTLGSFEVMNLDAGIPGNTLEEGLANGDDYRCQYSDPSWPNSTGYGTEAVTDCFPAMNLAHADAVFWQVDGTTVPESPDGGRAFTGTHSMYYGVFLTDPAGEFTTPLAVVEAVKTIDPVYLGLEEPKLSIWQQISLADERLDPAAVGRSFDRGVVQLQLADEQDDPASDWINLQPFLNIYDEQGVDNYFNCFFDPIDDGTTEDDFFYPNDPNRRHGPSSTCYPARNFAYLGDTGTPFHPDDIGNANEGPGLAGSHGTGTWIESSFDLDQWRGRRVRLRFLMSSVKAEFETLQEQYMLNPSPLDDGWWIDDVTVTGAVDAPASVAVDAKDNSSLPGPPGGDTDGDGFYDVCDNCPDLSVPNQGDADTDGLGDPCDPCPFQAGVFGPDPDLDGHCGAGDNCPEIFNPDQRDNDGDGAGQPCDCNDGNENIYPGNVESNNGIDDNCNGVDDEITGNAGFHNPDDKNEYSWDAQPGALRYQVARSEQRDFGFGGNCTLFPETTNTFIIDGDSSAPGTVLHYLVRPAMPNVGSWGQDSSGQERTFVCF